MITEEFVFILDCVFEYKLRGFKELSSDEIEGLLPRMERFWEDDSDGKIVIESWNMNNNYDYE
jgi:hypothetical protein